MIYSKKKRLSLSSSKSFTLIELLVVITVIGLLSSIIVVSLTKTKEKARDARRLLEIRQIYNAIMSFYYQYGDFPNNLSSGQTGYVAGYPGNPLASYGEGENTSPSNCMSFDSSAYDKNGNGKPFLEPLQDFGFIAKVPTDPKATLCGSPSLYSTGGYKYRYYRPTNGMYGGVKVGSIFWLAIGNLEGKTTTVPGCRIGSAAGYNNVFDYLICETQTGLR